MIYAPYFFLLTPELYYVKFTINFTNNLLIIEYLMSVLCKRIALGVIPSLEYGSDFRININPW